jgi:hypothetical protein
LSYFNSKERISIEFIIWSIKFPSYVSIQYELARLLDISVTFHIDNMNIDYKRNEENMQIEVDGSVLESAKDSLGYFETSSMFFEYILSLTNSRKYFSNFVIKS